MRLRLADIIEELQKASKPSEINNKSAYRIKMGDYRIGFILEDNLIKLGRIMNRKKSVVISLKFFSLFIAVLIE
jgi:mRNA-degrading endonuclease RelE of RelBE toxin-antitoxin system